MDRWDEMLEKYRANPVGIPFSKVEALLKGFGFESRHRSGSHYVFYHKLLPQYHLTIPKHDPVKPPYIRKAVQLVDLLREIGGL